MDEDFIQSSFHYATHSDQLSRTIYNQHQSDLCVIYALCKALSSAMRSYCQSNGLPMPEFDKQKGLSMIRIFATCVFAKSLDGVVKNARLNSLNKESQRSCIYDAVNEWYSICK